LLLEDEGFGTGLLNLSDSFLKQRRSFDALVGGIGFISNDSYSWLMAFD